jgi:RNA polymerase-binding transcription factor DksA
MTSPLNVSRDIIFGEGVVYDYRRTSTKTSQDHLEMSRPYDDNTVFAKGVSAYKRGDINILVSFLLDNGSRNFILRVADETRFTRNVFTAMKIYDKCMTMKTTFLLEIDGKKYDYVKDFYEKLRPKFAAAESSSEEKSRISKISAKKRKIITLLKKELKVFFINMMFVLAGNDFSAVYDMVTRSNMKINKSVLLNWKYKKRKEISKLRKINDYSYAKCRRTGDYFIIPPEYSERTDLSFRMLGIGDESVMKSFFTTHLNMHYLCFSKDEYTEDKQEEETSEFDEIELELESPEKLDPQEHKWLVSVYHNQYVSGDISIQQLTEKISKLST